MREDEEDALLAELFTLSGKWLEAPSIQHAFRRRFGTTGYKGAMDRLRSRANVEVRYVERRGKKFWEYSVAQ